MEFPRFIGVVWLALLCAFGPAHAEKRVALVVGNGAYVRADKLTNPVNDARGIRDALTGLKFDVLYGEDLDGKALRRMIGRFAGVVDNADVALVYFAGHGVTLGDAPYVVPVDAEFTNLDEMPAELVAVEELIADLRRAKGVRIAILDACRDNAAEQALKRSRGGAPSRGLAPPKNPAGLIIAYATQHGTTAADAAGSRNSPFTAALIANIATPGLDVKEMFFKVGSDVSAATRGRQRPEISISMFDRYALAPFAATPPPAGSALVAEAAQAWEAVKTSPSIEVIDAFLRQYEHVPVYGELARARRTELTKVAVVVTPPPPPRRDWPLTAAQERALQPKDTFGECENCPEMVVVPAGSFTMGSARDEKDRFDDELPQRIVTIRQPFAVGKLHVTRDQFAAFVHETKYEAGSRCLLWVSSTDGSWRNTGFAQEGQHPVVCVSWGDAKAYVDWLAKKSGKPYRLLTEAEWEYAARGRMSPGAYPRFWFGNDEKDLCQYGNGADQKARDAVVARNHDPGAAIRDYRGWLTEVGTTFAPCNDGYAYTSPAGHYEPNAFGLYDMFGNAWQWTEDCWHTNYSGAPNDGSAWTTGCRDRGHVVRGGCWFNDPRALRAANRDWLDVVGNFIGFRVARTLISVESSR